MDWYHTIPYIIRYMGLYSKYCNSSWEKFSHCHVFVSAFPVKASIVGVEFLYVEMLAHFQHTWVPTFHSFNYTPPHVRHTVTICCKVMARHFCLNVSLNIISMLAVASLKTKSRATYIFTFWVARAIRANTLPVVDHVGVLTGHKVCDSVTIARSKSHYFRGGWECVGTDGTLSSVA